MKLGNKDNTEDLMTLNWNDISLILGFVSAIYFLIALFMFLIFEERIFAFFKRLRHKVIRR